MKGKLCIINKQLIVVLNVVIASNVVGVFQ